jgi:hypothetical protein
MNSIVIVSLVIVATFVTLISMNAPPRPVKMVHHALTALANTTVNVFQDILEQTVIRSVQKITGRVFTVGMALIPFANPVRLVKDQRRVRESALTLMNVTQILA